MSYQALYRVFRPEGFSDVVGQEPIITTLVNQVLTGRIAHAYLFCGSRGTGKTSTAKVFARAINCLNPSDVGDPCGVCEVCDALSRDNNMDVIEIDAASNNGVDEIRELRDKIKYPPSVGRYKVYIVDEVHMLSTGAFNALLKTLEEPPSHAVFILATTEPQKLPATILSRCQRYDFKRIPARVIIQRLQKVLKSIEREADDQALSEIARSAEGGMRDALSLMDMCLAYGSGRLSAELVRDVLGASDRASLFDFAQALIEGNAGNALRLIERQMREGRDAQLFTREVAGHMRALMLAQLMGDQLAELLELTDEDAQRFIQQAEGVPQHKLMRVMELFMRAEGEMRWASQPRAVVELCAVRACHPEREQSIEALTERVAELEEKFRTGAIHVGPQYMASVSGDASADAVTDAPPMPDAPPDEIDQTMGEPMPTPIPAATPDAPAPTDAAAWAKAVELIREHNKALYPPVSNLKLMGVEGDAVRLTMPKKWIMYLGVLQQEAKRQILEQRLMEAFGRPMRVLLTQEDAQPKAVSQPAKNVLEQVYDLFGREHVSVIDDDFT